MCCFSVATPLSLFARLFAPRVHVSSTNIFARMLSPGVQALAYGMNLSSAKEVAMILPLPVATDTGEDAVKFISLEKAPKMFDELRELFEPLPVASARKGGLPFRLPSIPRLAVHKIGSFIASYVPRRADFARLDPRFRIPDVLFDAVPTYADFGFAVFQLAPGKVTVHPMALAFPTRAPDKLFFPTVHVHDGRFHATAKFDHALYYQHPRAPDPETRPFGVFDGDAVGWMKPHRSYEDLVLVDKPMVRRTLRAKLPNKDVWIDAT